MHIAFIGWSSNGEAKRKLIDTYVYYKNACDANGDIYFINFCYLNSIQEEIRKYYEEQRRWSQGYKKKAILEAIEENHDYYKVAEIVKKYFEIA